MISLRSDLRRRLLSWFRDNRSARIHVRRLAGILEVDPTNLSRELARLREDGIVRSELEGRQLYYSLNTENPELKAFFKELQKGLSVEATLQRALAGVPGVEGAMLMSAKERGSAVPAGDLRLIVVGSPEKAVVRARLKKAAKSLGRKITLTVRAHEEMKKVKNGKDAKLRQGKTIDLKREK